MADETVIAQAEGYVLSDKERMLLEMKRASGIATPEEIVVLRDAMRLVGDAGKLLVPGGPLTTEQWLAKYQDLTYPLLAEGLTLAEEPPADFQDSQHPERIVRS